MTMINETKWRFEKENDKVKVYITTGETPLSKMFRKTYLYEYKFEEEIEQFKPFSKIDIYINSTGGNGKSAFGVYDALKKLSRKARMRILIDGVCCSSATIFLGLKADIYITPDSYIYIHGAKSVKYEKGEAVSVSRSSKMAIATNEILNSIYCKVLRRNLTLREYFEAKKRLKVWMAEGRKIFPEGAAAYGFVKKIVEKKVFEEGG